MKTLAVLGAGMQGVAAAYDAAAFGQFEKIVVADCEIVAAIRGCQRINSLVGSEICEPARINATSRPSLQRFLPDFDVAIAALPYNIQAIPEEVAIGCGCSMVDMGQDPEPALKIAERDIEAKQRDVAVVTQAGLAPGLVNLFAWDLLKRYPKTTHLRAYAGDLPELPIPPLGYVIRFSVDGLIAEYSDEVLALRDGQVVAGEPLDLYEEVLVDGIGKLEAFTTSGGAGTAPYELKGKVANYEYKTLRYPGHLSAMKLFRDCGFWSTEPTVGLGISPRDAFSAVVSQALNHPEVRDIAIIRVEAESADGTHRIEMLEQQDVKTGFTAMERLTGFVTSIVAIEIAAGKIKPGCRTFETAVDSDRMRTELKKRGLTVRESAPATASA